MPNHRNNHMHDRIISGKQHKITTCTGARSRGGNVALGPVARSALLTYIESGGFTHTYCDGPYRLGASPDRGCDRLLVFADHSNPIVYRVPRRNSQTIRSRLVFFGLKETYQAGANTSECCVIFSWNATKSYTWETESTQYNRGCCTSLRALNPHESPEFRSGSDRLTLELYKLIWEFSIILHGMFSLKIALNRVE